MIKKVFIAGVELKAGDWCRARDGRIVYVYGINPGDYSLYPVSGSIGSFRWCDNEVFTLSGYVYAPDDEHDGDLVEILPDCTGFDWVAPPTRLKSDFDVADGQRIECGKGYRFLQYGEEIRPDDECFNWGDEWSDPPSSKFHSDSWRPIRRKLPVEPVVDPGEGYRLLVKDELVVKGDEFWADAWNGKMWFSTSNHKCMNGEQANYPYRRKLAIVNKVKKLGKPFTLRFGPPTYVMPAPQPTVTQEDTPPVVYPLFWVGRQWISDTPIAYTVQREAGGVIEYVMKDGSTCGQMICRTSPDASWILITEAEALKWLEVSDPDEDDDYYDEDDECEDDGEEDDDPCFGCDYTCDRPCDDDDSCGRTCNPPDPKPEVHYHITVNINMFPEPLLDDPAEPKGDCEDIVDGEESGYRPLSQDEVICAGDEFVDLLGKWQTFVMSVGETLRKSGIGHRCTRTLRPL